MSVGIDSMNLELTFCLFLYSLQHFIFPELSKKALHGVIPFSRRKKRIQGKKTYCSRFVKHDDVRRSQSFISLPSFMFFSAPVSEIRELNQKEEEEENYSETSSWAYNF